MKGNVKSTSSTAIQLSFSEEAMDYVTRVEDKTFYANGQFENNDLLANGIGCEKYEYFDRADPLENLFFDYGNIYKNIVFDNNLIYELNQADNFQLEFNETGDITKVAVFRNGFRTIDYIFEYRERNSIQYDKIHNWLPTNTSNTGLSQRIAGKVEFNDLNLISKFMYTTDGDYKRLDFGKHATSRWINFDDTVTFNYEERNFKKKNEITCRIDGSNSEKIINLNLDEENYISHYVVSGTLYQFEHGRAAKVSGNSPFILFEKSSITGKDSIYINSGNGFSIQSVKILRDENNNIKKIERNNPSGLDGCSIKYSLDNNENWIELSYCRPPSELKEIIGNINANIQREDNLFKMKRFSSYEEEAGDEFDLMMKQIEKQYYLNSKKKVIIIREIGYY